MYHTKQYSRPSRALKATAVSLLVLMTACVSAPEKYSAETAVHFTETYLRPAAAPLAQSNKPLSLLQVKKRTLSHNSEYARQERQFIETVKRTGHRAKDLLPQTYLNAFSTWRSNTNASIGTKLGEENFDGPKDFFTGQDQAYGIGNLTATWDLLELGLSGLKAKRRTVSAFNQGEQNQYLCNKLMVDVEQAYWKMVAFEKAAAREVWLRERIEHGLSVSKQRSEDDPESGLQELMFQRELLDINRWYESIYRGLGSAKADLARLMNLPIGQDFALDEKNLPETLSKFANTDVTDLVKMAYENRPEIRQAHYTKDMIKIQNRQDFWRHFPALKLFVGGNTDSNSFLLNQNYASAGLNLSWDLIKLGQIGKTKKMGQMNLMNRQYETEILAGAVMTQVMISHTQVQQLDHDLSLASRAHGVQSKITKNLEKGFETEEKPETYLVKEELMRELTSLRKDLARANLYGAQARLDQSVGAVSQCHSEVSETPIQSQSHSPALMAQTMQEGPVVTSYANFPEGWPYAAPKAPVHRKAQRYRHRG